MRDINFLEQDSSWFSAPSYDELIASFETPVLFSEHDDDYQGDSFYLLTNGREFGILVFGWGSCSGCDALEGCDSEQEVIELRNDLWNSITWRSEEEMIEYLRNHDAPSKWYYYTDAGRRFDDGLFDWFEVSRVNEDQDYCRGEGVDTGDEDE